MPGLDPESVIARISSENQRIAFPDLKQSIVVAAIGFTVVSMFMFGVWALAGGWMYRNIGAKMFYSLLGIGFMAGGGAAFSPVLIGNNLGRFYVLFVGSFFVYATIWMVCWFGFKAPGEWVATVVGPAIIALAFVRAFRARDQLKKCATAMILGHTVGYFMGEWLFYWEPLANRWGMMIWGMTYGAGFGAAIGATLYWCQTGTREALCALSTASVKPDSEEPAIASD